MAEELRIMENKSREDTNLSPVSKIEIYSFFDPFSKDCFKLSAILSKLRIEYNKYIKVRHILNPSLKVLTKCQAQSTSDFDNIALAYKAAELQGRIRAERFIHLMQNEIIPKRDIITEDMISDCINNAGIDYQVFKEDLQKDKLTELMGQPIEKNLPPKLEYYIQKKQLVTMEELLTIYEWPEKLLNKELKKLTLQQKVEKLQYPEGEFWKSKMPQC
ncbi:MAG: DsbA family protein [Staphylococcus epidermidis]|nr:DsbA family protein [Staphylococcus epidermidis]